MGWWLMNKPRMARWTSEPLHLMRRCQGGRTSRLYINRLLTSQLHTPSLSTSIDPEDVSNNELVQDEMDKITLRIDPKVAKTFQDLKIPEPLLQVLVSEFPNIHEPTQVQRIMLSLLKSDLSLLVRSGAGTGKTLATILFLLSFNRNALKFQGPFITNLVLVPTPDLAYQYYNIISRLIRKSPLNVHNVVQHVYRSDSEDEDNQIQLLKQFPGPHILVGTPTRVLDILSSSSRHLMPLFNLSCIAVDEADHLLPREILDDIPNFKLTRKSKAQVPTEILLNHIVSWRNGHVSRAYPDFFVPLRFLFESSTAGGYLKLLAVRRKWLSYRPMLRIGADPLGGSLANRLPRDVDNYFVTFDPTNERLTDTKFPEIESENLLSLDFGTTSMKNEWLKIHEVDKLKEVEEKLNGDIKATSNSSEAELNTELQDIEKSTDSTADEDPSSSDNLNQYCNALAKLFKAEQKRSLIIAPETFSIPLLIKLLQEQGISSATSQFSSQQTGVMFNDKVIDISTMFSSTAPLNSPEIPDTLVYRARGISGLDFEGLSRIYVMGWNSIQSTRVYLSLAGRCRVCDIKDRGETGKEGLWEGGERAKFVVISLNNELNEANMLSLASSMAKLDSTPSKYFAE